MMAAQWFPNRGHAPLWSPDWAGEACPPDRIPETEAAHARIFVRLGNGREPTESWPVAGRGAPRWSLTGDGWDIIEWRRV